MKKWAIFKYEEDNPWKLTMTASIGFEGSKVESLCQEVSFGHCICWKAAESGKIIFSTDSSADWWHDVQYEWMTSHWHYAVPIFNEKKLKWMLLLYTKDDHEPVQIETDVLEIITCHLASVMERYSLRKQMAEIQKYDYISGLLNTTAFVEELNKSISLAKRHDEELTVATTYINARWDDGIEIMLDSEPKLLQSISTILKNIARVTDSITYLWWNKFCIICPKSNDENNDQIAEKIIKDVSDSIVWKWDNQIPTIKIGLSEFPKDWSQWSTLMRQSKSTLESMDVDGNWYKFWKNEKNEKLERKKLVEQRLREAVKLATKEGASNSWGLELYWQPQLDLATWNLVWTEVLCRWIDYVLEPKYWFVSPLEFISIAEESDLIIDLDRWVTRETCKQVVEWQKDWLPRFRAAVNASAREFDQDFFVSDIEKILENTWLDPKYLEVEITERLAMTSVEWTIDTLNRFLEAWIHSAIDDFWVDNSSLWSLKYFPVKLLKIDRMFLKGLEEDPHSAVIIKTIIFLAHGLDMEVLCEWVEKGSELRILWSLWCDQVQGYHTWKPMNKADFTEFLVDELQRLWDLIQDRLFNVVYSVWNDAARLLTPLWENLVLCIKNNKPLLSVLLTLDPAFRNLVDIENVSSDDIIACLNNWKTRAGLIEKKKQAKAAEDRKMEENDEGWFMKF